MFPDAAAQTCIVHLLRNSLDFVSFKDRKSVATTLKDIYRAVDAEADEKALTAFEEGGWELKHHAIGHIWRRAWPEAIPLFAFADEVRRIACTGGRDRSFGRKAAAGGSGARHFPNDEAATKLLLLRPPIPGCLTLELFD